MNSPWWSFGLPFSIIVGSLALDADRRHVVALARHFRGLEREPSCVTSLNVLKRKSNFFGFVNYCSIDLF